MPGSADQIVARRPAWMRAELRRLLALASAFDTVAANAVMSDDFRAAARARLMQRIAASGSPPESGTRGTTPPATHPAGRGADDPTGPLPLLLAPIRANGASAVARAPAPPVPGARPSGAAAPVLHSSRSDHSSSSSNDSAVSAARPPRKRRSRWLWRGALGGLLAAMLALLATLSASASSLPGQPLYGIKQATEELGVRLAPDDQARTRIVLRQANARLAQLQTLIASAPQPAQDELQEALVATERSRALVADPKPTDPLAALTPSEPAVGSDASNSAAAAANDPHVTARGDPPRAAPTPVDESAPTTLAAAEVASPGGSAAQPPVDLVTPRSGAPPDVPPTTTRAAADVADDHPAEVDGHQAAPEDLDPAPPGVDTPIVTNARTPEDTSRARRDPQRIEHLQIPALAAPPAPAVAQVRSASGPSNASDNPPGADDQTPVDGRGPGQHVDRSASAPSDPTAANDAADDDAAATALRNQNDTRGRVAAQATPAAVAQQPSTAEPDDHRAGGDTGPGPQIASVQGATSVRAAHDLAADQHSNASPATAVANTPAAPPTSARVGSSSQSASASPNRAASSAGGSTSPGGSVATSGSGGAARPAGGASSPGGVASAGSNLPTGTAWSPGGGTPTGAGTGGASSLSGSTPAGSAGVNAGASGAGGSWPSGSWSSGGGSSPTGGASTGASQPSGSASQPGGSAPSGGSSSGGAAPSRGGQPSGASSGRH
jgi:hypothetical protein